MARKQRQKKLNPRVLDDRLQQLGIDKDGKKLLKRAILRRQKGKCPICQKNLTTGDISPQNIQLDHSHKPPFEIRGVLCSYCNKYMITKMNEHHPDWFYRTYLYLSDDKSWIEKLVEKFRK